MSPRLPFKVNLFQENNTESKRQLKGTMAAMVRNTLKSQKSRLHQWKPKNNSPVLLKVTTLLYQNYQQVTKAADDRDGNGLQLEKFGPTFSSVFFL